MRHVGFSTGLYRPGTAQKPLAWQAHLTLVSDEETGGRWGSGYLLEHMPDEVLGDCVLSGEPSSLQTVRYGEKAILGVDLHCENTSGAHGAYPHLSKSATKHCCPPHSGPRSPGATRPLDSRLVT